ncbi:MAG: hypothetical protein JJE28_02625 [Actinomycetales bacterium]|nr:hypothetical protein [Actinomycetales bacterium]
MITLTEAQTWAALGLLTAALLGTITLVTTLLGRTITAQFAGLRGEMNARFDAVGARFDAVDTRFDTVDVRFAAVNARIDNLDRDVQGLAQKVFGKEF